MPDDAHITAVQQRGVERDLDADGRAGDFGSTFAAIIAACSADALICCSSSSRIGSNLTCTKPASLMPLMRTTRSP
ncbi:MAG: hypothetical protein U0703_03645 [Anaerolineae bacterium]